MKTVSLLASTSVFTLASLIGGCGNMIQNSAETQAVVLKSQENNQYLWMLLMQESVKTTQSNGKTISYISNTSHNCLYSATSKELIDDSAKLTELFSQKAQLVVPKKFTPEQISSRAKAILVDNIRKSLNMPAVQDEITAAQALVNEISSTQTQISKLFQTRISGITSPTFGDVQERIEKGAKYCRGFLGLGKNEACLQKVENLQQKLKDLNLGLELLYADAKKFGRAMNIGFVPVTAVNKRTTLQGIDYRAVMKPELRQRLESIESHETDAHNRLETALKQMGERTGTSKVLTTNKPIQYDDKVTSTQLELNQGGVGSLFVRNDSEVIVAIKTAAEQLAKEDLTSITENKCPTAKSLGGNLVMNKITRIKLAPPVPQNVKVNAQLRIVAKSNLQNGATALLDNSKPNSRCYLPKNAQLDVQVQAIDTANARAKVTLLDPQKGVNAICGAASGSQTTVALKSFFIVLKQFNYSRAPWEARHSNLVTEGSVGILDASSLNYLKIGAKTADGQLLDCFGKNQSFDVQVKVLKVTPEQRQSYVEVTKGSLFASCANTSSSNTNDPANSVKIELKAGDRFGFVWPN